MAYELIGEDKEKERFIYEDLDFWRYQPEVNMEILDLELRNRTQQEQHMILKKFLELVCQTGFSLELTAFKLNQTLNF
jgi:ABC-type cobalamin transport system ATPase subunit